MVLNLDRAQLKKKNPATKEIYYPESDGKPMAESDLHRDLMTYLIHLLQRFLRGTKAYVSGNLLIYYEEGNPRKSVAPDCFVVLGVEQYRRRTYRMWDEGKAPDIVFEVSSNSTKREDTGKKMKLYAQLGVKEYFIYDPTGDYLKRYLEGYILQPDSSYRPMQPVNEQALEESKTQNSGALERSTTPEFVSEVLGLRFAIDMHNQLVAYNQETGEQLLSDEEARYQAELKADTVLALYEEAQAKIAALEARLESTPNND